MLEADKDRPAMRPDELWLTPDGFFTSLQKFARFSFKREGNPDEAQLLQGVGVDRKSQNPIAKLINFTTTAKARGMRTLIAATSVGRMGTMGELFRASGLTFTEFNSWDDFLTSTDPVGLVAAPLYQGSVLTDPKVAVLTETELYAASLTSTDPVGLVAAPLYQGSVLTDPKVAVLTETELYAASPTRSRLRRQRASSNIEMIVSGERADRPQGCGAH